MLIFSCKIFICTLSKAPFIWVSDGSLQVKVHLYQECQRTRFFSLSSLFLLWSLSKSCTLVLLCNNITNHEIFGLGNVMRKFYMYNTELSWTVQTMRKDGLGSHSKHLSPNLDCTLRETEVFRQELSVGTSGLMQTLQIIYQY